MTGWLSLTIMRVFPQLSGRLSIKGACNQTDKITSAVRRTYTVRLVLFYPFQHHKDAQQKYLLATCLSHSPSRYISLLK